MARFANGKFAYGISDRSGFRYKLNEMKREWTGMLVGPDEYEPKQPQLEPRRKAVDPQALLNPRPQPENPTSAFGKASFSSRIPCKLTISGGDGYKLVHSSKAYSTPEFSKIFTLFFKLLIDCMPVDKIIGLPFWAM